ncbi:hypothetical protein DSCW_01100 [Desulfosarcina widdelii]|uniref:HTH merR-type domain-containing protein n=1 Tax=Desulfosarcina widdelii TaxID=947919 RepID=A0A5K7YXN2_9BACT|nr:MerR family transcriptional regulator [Desulfosarcina widdelii]BBO72693.1 hypothetical protein DSCW_01100 [Desulfosarcina widdelii]
MKNKFYTKKEMSEHSGLTPRTVDLYTNIDLIFPEVANPTGRGTTRKYSNKNLAELMVAKKLTDNRVPLKEIKEIFDLLTEKKQRNRLDPYGEWGWRESNLSARLYIYRHEDEILDVFIEGRRPRIEPKKYDSVLEINIERIFEYFEEG